MPYVNEDDLKTGLSNLKYLIAHSTDPRKLVGYKEMEAECQEQLLVMLIPLTANRLRRAETLLATSQRNIASTRGLLTLYRARRRRETT
jgi:hypothetical protein